MLAFLGLLLACLVSLAGCTPEGASSRYSIGNQTGVRICYWTDSIDGGEDWPLPPEQVIESEPDNCIEHAQFGVSADLEIGDPDISLVRITVQLAEADEILDDTFPWRAMQESELRVTVEPDRISLGRR